MTAPHVPNTPDAEFLLEEARASIAGRLALWKGKRDSHVKRCVVANLEWTLSRLGTEPGRLAALREKYADQS